MKNYALKWIIQRVTAVFLIPLTFWFIYSTISLSKMEYNEISIFFKSYLNSFLFYIMFIFMLLHSKLGLQTIIEDYVTSKKIIKNIRDYLDLSVYLLMIFMTILILRNII